MKKYLSLALFAAILLQTAACGSSGAAADTTTVPEEVTTTAEETTAPYVPAELDYGGKTVSFFIRTNDAALAEYYSEEQNGEIVSDAIFNRNSAVEEAFKVKITQIRDTDCLGKYYPHIPLWQVQGNCDFCSFAPESGLEEVDGVRIFFAHGHRHNVKLNMDSFCNSVCFSGAKLGLYGHTHQPRWNSVGGMEFLNPGSIGDHRRPSYAIVETTGSGQFSCRICYLEEE